MDCKRMRALACCAGALTLVAAGPAKQVDPLAPTARWTANTRGAAKTPAMGWNSWNAFHTDVDEEKVLGAAQAIVDSGLAKLGYRYINLDDGWWMKRRLSDGRLQVRTSIFPSARTGGPEETSFRPFVDRIHSMGLKAGIYTDVGRNACSQAYGLDSPNLPVGTAAEREVGLYGHVDQDIRLFFKEWAFDYVKVDACGIADYGAERAHVKSHGYRPFQPLMYRGMVGRTDIPTVQRLYAEVGQALDRYNPDGDYVFSICNWGQANVRAWGKQIGNSWRTSDDITPNWTRMLHTFDSAVNRPLYAQPHTWNDPDMLFIGTGDFDANHLTEARSHFSLWAIINAPLLIGYDLRNAPKSLMDIWGNADLVAINQDPAGNQGVLAYDSDDAQIIVKTMSDGRKAVAVFNRGLGPVKLDLLAEHLKFAKDSDIKLRDLWSKQRLPAFRNQLSVEVAPRETRVFMAEGTRALDKGFYLSELPGSVNVAVDGVVRPEADPSVHKMLSPWGGTRSPERPNYAGWGGAQADAGPYGSRLQIAGASFASGIGTLANSRLEVKTEGKFSRFRAQVGVDDSTRNAGSRVRFLVYADGKLIGQTASVGFGQSAVPIDLAIGKARIVELVARSDASVQPASVTWGDAALMQ
ncbi:MAG: NPCBM/NEW2 domain-containing protein [Sphingomicrobium sp.]